MKKKLKPNKTVKKPVPKSTKPTVTTKEVKFTRVEPKKSKNIIVDDYKVVTVKSKPIDFRALSLICVVDEVQGGWTGYYDSKSGKLLAQGYRVSELELLEKLNIPVEFINIDTEAKLKAVGKDLPERLTTLKKRLEIQ